MFTLNDDKSIYMTRGDEVFFSVSAEDNGVPYKFKAGDVLRFKAYGKKDALNVVIQKDFPVLEETEVVTVYLTEADTKIGEVISKPKDYWYELELDPGDNPKTIIGYDEDGPKVLKLFPEGADTSTYVPDPEDIAVMDDELDMTSTRPVQNQAIARAVIRIEGKIRGISDYITPQKFGAKGDGAADDTVALQAAIDVGGHIVLPCGTYRVTDALTIKSCTVIDGNGSTIVSNLPVIFKGSGLENVTIQNMKLVSTVDISATPDMSETEADGRGYLLTDGIISIDSSNLIRVERCNIKGSFCGIFIFESTNVTVSDNEVCEASHICVCLSGCQFICTNNYIHDVKVCESADGYPTYLFQATDTVLSQQQSIIANNRMINNPMWDGIMCHRGADVIISNNQIVNVRNGIDLTTVTTEAYKFGNIIVKGNELIGTTVNKWASSALNNGILLLGNADNVYDGVSISHNIVKGFGRFSSPSGMSQIHLENIKNVIVNGNIVEMDCTLQSDYRGAIAMKGNIHNLSLLGNNIKSNVLPILINNPTVDTMIVSHNIADEITTPFIRFFTKSVITNMIIENNSEHDIMDYIEAGASVNGVVFDEDTANSFYISPLMKLRHKDEARAITANSRATFYIETPKTIPQTACVVANAGVGFDRRIICIGRYNSSKYVEVNLYNVTSEDITLPEVLYTVKVEN